jgi:PPOX class probable F420-dependent enzyme
MAARLTEDDVALLREAQLAHVASTMPDGAPQVTPVWVDTDGQAILVNVVQGMQKHKHLLRDPRVAVSVADRENPFRVLIVRGKAELVEEGAEEHIDALAKKYLGVETYPNRRPGQRRIIARIAVTSRFDLSKAVSDEEWQRLGKDD